MALELDQQERAFMAEGGIESEEYLKYIAEDSGNVAADGNFSVQVCQVPHEQNHSIVVQDVIKVHTHVVGLRVCRIH